MLNLLLILNLHTASLLRISSPLDSLLEEYIEKVLNFEDRTPRVKPHQLTSLNIQLPEKILRRKTKKNETNNNVILKKNKRKQSIRHPVQPHGHAYEFTSYDPHPEWDYSGRFSHQRPWKLRHHELLFAGMDLSFGPPCFLHVAASHNRPLTWTAA